MADTQEINRILGDLEQEILTLRDSELANLVKLFSDKIRELITSIENVNFPQKLSDISSNIKGNNENMQLMANSLKEFVNKLSEAVKSINRIDKNIDDKLNQINNKIDNTEKLISKNINFAIDENKKVVKSQNIFFYIIIMLLIAVIVLRFVN